MALTIEQLKKWRTNIAFPLTLAEGLENFLWTINAFRPKIYPAINLIINYTIQCLCHSVMSVFYLIQAIIEKEKAEKKRLFIKALTSLITIGVIITIVTLVALFAGPHALLGIFIAQAAWEFSKGLYQLFKNPKKLTAKERWKELGEQLLELGITVLSCFIIAGFFSVFPLGAQIALLLISVYYIVQVIKDRRESSKIAKIIDNTKQDNLIELDNIMIKPKSEFNPEPESNPPVHNNFNIKKLEQSPYTQKNYTSLTIFNTSTIDPEETNHPWIKPTTQSR